MALRAVYPRLTRHLQRPVALMGRIGDHTLFYGKALAACAGLMLSERISLASA